MVTFSNIVIIIIIVIFFYSYRFHFRSIYSAMITFHDHYFHHHTHHYRRWMLYHLHKFFPSPFRERRIPRLRLNYFLHSRWRILLPFPRSRFLQTPLLKSPLYDLPVSKDRSKILNFRALSFFFLLYCFTFVFF